MNDTIVTTIIGAIIGAVITALLGAVGWIFKSKFFENPTKRKLDHDRLEYIYSPLYHLISDENSTKLADFYTLASSIKEEHPSIIPERLSEYHRTYGHSYNSILSSAEEHFGQAPVPPELKSYVETNYNYLRKKLGYDEYEKNKINIKALNNYHQLRNRVVWIKLVFNASSTAIGGVAIGIGLSGKNLTIFLSGLCFSIAWIASAQLQGFYDDWDV